MKAPREDDPERILLFGAPGSGKSTAALSIAAACPEAHILVLDTDRAYRRMLLGRDLANVHVTDGYEWPHYGAWLTSAAKDAGPGDWIVIDSIDTAWDAVQAGYIESVFGVAMDDFFLQARKAARMQDPKGLDGWKDWSVINRMYSAWMDRLVHGTRCHVLATAKVDALERTDAKEAKFMFGPLGMKPKGQKSLSHAFHSVLFLAQEQAGEYSITTAGKDRERQRFAATPLRSFAVQYLVGKAGWTTEEGVHHA